MEKSNLFAFLQIPRHKIYQFKIYQHKFYQVQKTSKWKKVTCLLIYEKVSMMKMLILLN